MKTSLVKSIRGDYKVWLSNGLLGKTGEILRELGLSGKVMIVTQKNAARHYLKKISSSLIKNRFRVIPHFVKDGETAKSQEELFGILSDLCDKNFERKDTVLALGGGVVGDLAGFAASVYLRGIPFVNIPTTLLAQVDSSVGGKTGINLKQGKNLVGTFYPPKAVLMGGDTLKTLPRRELCAALAEVVKYGVIQDARLFDYLEKNADKILAKDPQALEKIIETSSSIKAGIVSCDEHETKGKRLILNFGHTFGHGLEKAMDYRKLLHGEAVSLGMVCAADLAVKLKMLSEKDFSRILRLLKKFHLPVSLSGLGINAARVLSAMSHDKKKKAGKLRFVLPLAIGKVTVREDISEVMMGEILLSHGAKL